MSPTQQISKKTNPTSKKSPAAAAKKTEEKLPENLAHGLAELHTMPVGNILALQRTAGNQALTRVLKQRAAIQRDAAGEEEEIQTRALVQRHMAVEQTGAVDSIQMRKKKKKDPPPVVQPPEAVIPAPWTKEEYAELKTDLREEIYNALTSDAAFQTALTSLKASWGASNLKIVLKKANDLGAGAISLTNLVKILQISVTRGFMALPVWNAMVSEPVYGLQMNNTQWSAVLNNVAAFAPAAALGGLGKQPDSMGGAEEVLINVWDSAAKNYSMKIYTTANRKNHFGNGHTFESFKFTYENCTRAAQSTFWAAGSDPAVDVRASASTGATQALAKQAIENNAWRQGPAGSFTVGLLATGQVAMPPGQEQRWSARIDQFYPSGGTAIKAIVLCAIGRLYNLM